MDGGISGGSSASGSHPPANSTPATGTVQLQFIILLFCFCFFLIFSQLIEIVERTISLISSAFCQLGWLASVENVVPRKRLHSWKAIAFRENFYSKKAVAF